MALVGQIIAKSWLRPCVLGVCSLCERNDSRSQPDPTTCWGNESTFGRTGSLAKTDPTPTTLNWRSQMTLIKSLLLGSAAGIVAVATAQAADLPTRKAAPVEYVRVCNVGGITGWTLPGSDTCVKFSGYMTAHFIGGNLSNQYNSASAVQPAAALAIGGANGAHFSQTLMVQGSDVAPDVFNGSAAPVTIAGVTYAPGATIMTTPTTPAAA